MCSLLEVDDSILALDIMLPAAERLELIIFSSTTQAGNTDVQVVLYHQKALRCISEETLLGLCDMAYRGLVMLATWQPLQPSKGGAHGIAPPLIITHQQSWPA